MAEPYKIVDRPGSPRPAADEDQALLRVPEPVRAAAQLRDVPGLPRACRASLPVMNRTAFELGPEGGARPELQDRPLHQVGPQELLLPRPAEELPDQPVRPAALPRRLARDRLSQRRRAEKTVGIIRAHLEEDAGKNCTTNRAAAATRSSTSTAPARRCWRSSPSRTCTSPEEAEGVSRRAAAAAARPRRLRLRDAGRAACAATPTSTSTSRQPDGNGRHDAASSRSRTSTASAAVEPGDRVRGGAAVSTSPARTPGTTASASCRRRPRGWDDATRRDRASSATRKRPPTTATSPTPTSCRSR